MAKITKRLVDSLRPDPDREIYVGDDELPGFGVRMRSSGTASYIVRYRDAAGRSRRATLGRVGVLAPDEARRMAQQHLAAAKLGADAAKDQAEATSPVDPEASSPLDPVPTPPPDAAATKVTQGIDALRQFRLFAELEDEDFEAIARIARVRDFEVAEKLATEGAAADRLYLFLQGQAAVKMRDPYGRQVLIDEIGPGELLGWGAVTEPHVYTASAWTTKPSQAIVIDGKRLRDLCEQNRRIGYEVAKGVGEVISKRFGLAVAGRNGHALKGHGIDELRQFKIFSELDLGDLDAIARIAYVRHYEPGVELTVEGAPADHLFLFLSGAAIVQVRDEDGTQTVVDELGPGELLGWAAVMEPHVYTASASTTEPCELIVVNGTDLRELCQENKQLGYQVCKGIGEVMSCRFEQAVGGREVPVFAGRGIECLRHFRIFAELEDEQFDAIARIASCREIGEGEQLTTEGTRADRLYLFARGKASIKVRGADGRQVLIDEIGPGEILGWGAVTGPPHVYTASAWTSEPCEVIAIDGEELLRLCDADKRMGYLVARGIGDVVSRRFGRVRAGRQGQTLGGHGIDELRQFKIFAELDVADLDAIARVAYVREFDAGEELITEGAPADQLYLFLTGKAVVKVWVPDGRQVTIDELGPGEVLGWGAVMEPHIYTASAWTTEPSELVIVRGDDLRELFESNKQLGYQVCKGIGEVMSTRFGQAVRGHGIDELHQFKIFADLDFADLDAIGRIAHIREAGNGEELITEGRPAHELYLLLKGKVEVKVQDPDGRQVLIDEIGPGDVLGWSAAVEPYVYIASAWASESCELIVVNGERLRQLCETNKRLGYQVTRGIGEVISRRFGRAAGARGDLQDKDLRAFGGEERVIWDDGQLQLTTEAVLMGMGTDCPEVIPLEVVCDVDVEDRCVVFRLHDGDIRSHPLDDAAQLAALVRDAMLRSRHAQRRKDYYVH
jgi:CRP-like cAMP-binding protein